jgi:hypothetical protein
MNFEKLNKMITSPTALMLAGAVMLATAAVPTLAAIVTASDLAKTGPQVVEFVKYGCYIGAGAYVVFMGASAVAKSDNRALIAAVVGALGIALAGKGLEIVGALLTVDTSSFLL